MEFTVEPFVEGDPGPHVTAPADAARTLGFEIEVGPFGSNCEVTDDRVGEVVGAIVQAAVSNGATHVTVDVGAGDASPGQASPGDVSAGSDS